MIDRIFYEIYNILTKESAVLSIDKGVDIATTTRLFYEQYGRDGWVMVKLLPYKGGKDGE